MNLGLTKQEVEQRINKGLVNFDDSPKTKTISKIIFDNVFNYFNFLNLALGLAVFIVSFLSGNILDGLKNCLFMGVIMVNTIISIIEEIISKRIIDKLSVISDTKCVVIRDNKEEEVSLESIVIDDVIKLSLGHQVVSDSIILEGEVEVNESLITGESNPIKKKKDDTLLSGSFIVSGNAKAKVIHIGKDNYSAKISNEAKYKKDINSLVMGSFTKVLKILSILILPIGLGMYIKEYSVTGNIKESVFTTVASLIGMIPEGLILLTSSVMAVGIIKLYKVKVLVQQLYAIEILARIDTICLDKTGTLTEGSMVLKDIIPIDKYKKEEFDNYLKMYALASNDTNPTMLAIKNHYKGDKIDAISSIPFSSDRKYSSIEFKDFTLYLGAPEVVFKNNKEIESLEEDYRILVLAKKVGNNLTKIGYILIEDVIRKSAKETLNYFKENNVDVKIISGDNIKTVSSIAKKVGITNIEGINIGDMSIEEVKEISDKYTIFGRVKPEQKKWIIQSLKEKGHIVAMTGDGVNDVLALKESDCAISIKSGTNAARNVSQLILLNDDFNSLPNVVKEGRQVINNVERSASLLLVKTLYTIMAIAFSIMSLQKYFFIPIQLTFITTFTIGTPSFFLALEPNKSLVEGNFLLRILSKSLPVAMTVVFNIVLVSIFSSVFNLSSNLQSSLCVILTTVTGMIYLFKICRPFTKYRMILFLSMFIGFIISLIIFPDFFSIEPLSKVSLLITFVLTIDSIYIYKVLNHLITYLLNKKDKTIKIEKI